MKVRYISKVSVLAKGVSKASIITLFNRSVTSASPPGKEVAASSNPPAVEVKSDQEREISL